MIKIRPNSLSEGINHFKSGRKRNHKLGKCSLRGKIERACRPNQLLRLGTNVPSAPHSATCRLLLQLWEFPLICLRLRALGTELGPGFFCPALSCLPPSTLCSGCTRCARSCGSCTKVCSGIIWGGEQGSVSISASVVHNSRQDVQIISVLPNADLAESSCSPRFTKESWLKLMVKPPHLSHSDMALEDNLFPLNS